MEFKIKLTTERKRLCLTQVQLAQKIGASPQLVCDWEKGRSFPSRALLIKLEDLFDMTHRELFAPANDDKPFSSTN